VALLVASACGGSSDTAAPTTTTETVTGQCGASSGLPPCASDPTVGDPQALMGRKSGGFHYWDSPGQLNGAVVCVLHGSVAEEDLEFQMELSRITSGLIEFELLSSGEFDEVAQNFVDGSCDVITAASSALTQLMETQQPASQEWVIFYEGQGWFDRFVPTTTVAPTTTVTESVGKRNAREKAARYLEYSAFSRSGLIDQLEFEGFTRTQAEYGVNAVGY